MLDYYDEWSVDYIAISVSLREININDLAYIWDEKQVVNKKTTWLQLSNYNNKLKYVLCFQALKHYNITSLVGDSSEVHNELVYHVGY